MTKPYSTDLRQRVLDKVLEGVPIRQIGKQFSVSPSFVSRLHTRYRETGSIEPLPQGGDRWSHHIEAHADWLLSQVEQTPDITLAELRVGLLEQHGFNTSTNAVSNFMKRHGLTYKTDSTCGRTRAARRSPGKGLVAQTATST